MWWHEGGYLVFSDIHNNRHMKYEPGKGISLLLEPTNRANDSYADIGIMAIMPSAGLCRMARATTGKRPPSHAAVRHN